MRKFFFFIKCAFVAGTPYVSISLFLERIFALVNTSNTKKIIYLTFLEGNYNVRRVVELFCDITGTTVGPYRHRRPT
jgi:hypothetical protein